ncbi:MAG: hypothetical protein WD044_05605 [Dongiaceae bacterium]
MGKRLQSLLRLFGGRLDPIENRLDLHDFLQAQSSFVAQKAVVEYCRIKAGIRWQKLFAERAFIEALEESRWISMRAVLFDLTLIVEGYLRSAAVPRQMELADALVSLIDQLLADYVRDATWQRDNEAAIVELRRRLALAQVAEPQAPDKIAKASGNVVFDLMPVHADLRAHDRQVVVNNVRFSTLRVWETMTARIADRSQLVASLLAAPVASRADD